MFLKELAYRWFPHPKLCPVSCIAGSSMLNPTLAPIKHLVLCGLSWTCWGFAISLVLKALAFFHFYENFFEAELRAYFFSAFTESRVSFKLHWGISCSLAVSLTMIIKFVAWVYKFCLLHWCSHVVIFGLVVKNPGLKLAFKLKEKN